ncbi:MAG TPA: hypothetical protein VMU64_01250 [Acidimicrobiales bacterium]|nr:hypothetical protein [Acidimicrobiales bacterium]
MKATDVLGVLGALEAQEVPHYVAGGWGVDALLGRQSRSHDDLDVAIDDYENEAKRAIDALEPLGFRLVSATEQRAWMPRLSILDDGAGHRVELVSLDWRILAREFGQSGSDGSAHEAFEHLVYTEGTLGGQRVPCLSAEVQLLYHIGFELSPTLQHDVSLLRDELGASLPDPHEQPQVLKHPDADSA